MTTSPVSGTVPSYDRSHTVDKLFEDTALCYPDRIAVEDDAFTLTYHELRIASARLASRLTEAGVIAGDAVGVSIERSAVHVVSLLGILKVGAHYVPLPLDQPLRRRQQLADLAAIRLVLHDEGPSEGLGVPVLRCAVPALLERIDTATASPSQARPNHDAGDLAYVMFTSGSTGSPKGVAVTHRNIVRLVRGQHYAGFEPTASFLHLASPTFDASTFEIWGALLNGGRLVVAPPGSPSLDILAPLLTERGVTTAFITTALFHEIVDLRPELLTKLDWLLIGGEPMSLNRAHRVVELLGPRVANVYGPTEATTFSTYFPLNELTPEMVTVPIGRSLEHGHVLVVDDQLRQCPEGTVGEIVVTGDGVSKGYLNDDPMTQSKFLCSAPKASEEGPMYRTGDLGRYLVNGAIEFLGRRDEQVKIRGYRVEPGEIESALDRHEDVRQAAVVVVERPDAAHLLVAFAVAEANAEPQSAQLKAFLGLTLPPYMVPQQVHVVDSLPLTTTAKVDKAALREQARADTRPLTDGSPFTPTMSALARLWRLVLALPADSTLEATSDFFVLGGDSLLVLRLIAAAEEELLPISVSDVFNAPELSKLGALVDSRHALSNISPKPSTDTELVLRGDVPDAYPATQMQLGMIYEGEASEDGSLYHDGISVSVAAPLDLTALDATFQFLAIRHEVLRTRFDLSSFDVAMQIVEASPRIPVSASDTRGYSRCEVEAEVTHQLAVLMRPFDVEEQPLLRVHGVRLDDGHFQLLFAFHHALMDGWSESVLLTEFAVAYPALRAGQTPALPPRPSVRYSELCRLEQESLSDSQEVGYWRDAISAATSTLVRPRSGTGRIRSADRVSKRINLPGRVNVGLASLSRTVGTPIKSIMLAGHLAVISDATSRVRVSTGLVVNGRPERADADRMVGLFLNVLPITVDLAAVTWRTLIRRSFEAEQNLLPHRWYPFPAVAREARYEMFDTAFNYVQFHLYAVKGEAPSVEMSNQQVLDKASVPLMIDVVRAPGGDGLSLELIAESPLWSPGSLDLLADSYCAAYEALLTGLDSPVATPPPDPSETM